MERKRIALRHLVGSLGLRVALICVAFIIVPLVVHSIVLWHRDYQTRMRALFFELSSFAKAHAHLINQWIELRSLDANLIENGAVSFEVLAQKLKLSGLFSFSLEEGKWICKNGSEPSLIGKTFFSEELSLASERGTLVFISRELSFISTELVLLKTDKTKKKCLAFITAGQSWLENIAAFGDVLGDFNLSLVDPSGQIVLTTKPQFEREKMEIFHANELNKWMFSLSIWDVFTNRESRLAIEIPIEDASFSLLANLSHLGIDLFAVNHFLYPISSLFIILLFIGGGTACIMTIKMGRPLKQLFSVMEKVQHGDLNARYEKEKMGFEINVLGRGFNQMIEDLLTQMETAKSEKISRELLENELKIGHEIQKTLFPKEIPQIPGIDIGTKFIPAKTVAGDFYDLFAPDDNTLLFSIADGSGKGIGASLFSLSVRSTLRSLAKEKHSLDRILLETNNLLYLDTVGSHNFVTAWVGLFDRRQKKLYYHNSGHLPAILRRSDGTMHQLRGDGIALGVMELDHLSIQEMTLRKGDFLILYTDGIIEARNREKETFGIDRLKELIKHAQSKKSQDLVNIIIHEVQNFSSGLDQEDDITLLIINLNL
ncbi:MAG: SpoIIE family protein phosphatase [Chlamydiae bacterium]|nr:SpoIIE family protein phosphatase [Chlamydiota bacterium]